jgi:hypothetical protein
VVDQRPTPLHLALLDSRRRSIPSTVDLWSNARQYASAERRSARRLLALRHNVCCDRQEPRRTAIEHRSISIIASSYPIQCPGSLASAFTSKAGGALLLLGASLPWTPAQERSSVRRPRAPEKGEGQGKTEAISVLRTPSALAYKEEDEDGDAMRFYIRRCYAAESDDA